MQNLFGFYITTRKSEVNHIVTLNSIKHIYLPVFLTDIGELSIKYKEVPFSQLFPYVYCLFVFFLLETSHVLIRMTRSVL